MPKVFVMCHNPVRYGKVTWEGHEIVGYVDVSDGPSAGLGDAPYYNGWNSIPKSLRGTIDIVLSMYCPVAIPLQSGNLKTFTEVSPEDVPMYGHQTQEIFTHGFALVKPGGYMLFPRIRTVSPVTMEAIRTTLPPNKNTVDLVDIPKPRWVRHRQSDDYDVNEDYSVEPLKGLKITKPVSGGRRRKTRRHHRSRRTRRRIIP